MIWKVGFRIQEFKGLKRQWGPPGSSYTKQCCFHVGAEGPYLWHVYGCVWTWPMFKVIPGHRVLGPPSNSQRMMKFVGNVHFAYMAS